MDIPQGYKQTELGIIPEDWEIINLGSIAKVNGRIGFRGYTTADLVGVGQGAYTIGGKHITNMILDLHDAEYISWLKYYESPEIMVRKGDIVFAQRGTLGKSAFIRNDIGPATINPSLVLINKIKCDNEYLSYWLQCDKIVEYICSINSQTSIPMITQNQIEHIPVILPTIKDEQRAITEALSDIDGLIVALDKKIAKKRLIKQGAMQQLLTGKKRLPGFSDPWEEKKLGEILDYEQPQPYLVVSTDYVDSGIPVLTAGKSLILGYTTEQFGIYNKLPVIIFDDFTTDSKYVSYPFKVKSSAMKMLSLKNNNYDLRLVYELMQQIDFPLKDHQRYWISEYSQMTIFLPKDREEQTAIATILHDMDKEIVDLEAKRDKYRLLKSGMMQKLQYFGKF